MATIYIVHSTDIARRLALEYPDYHHRLHTFDGQTEADKRGVGTIHQIERRACKTTHVLCSNSYVVALELKHLVGRSPNVLLPIGVRPSPIVSF